MNNLKTHSLTRELLIIFFVLVIIQTVGALANVPASPSPLSPGTSYEPGEVIDTRTPELRWSGVPGAEYYSLSIRKYPYSPGDIVYNPQQIYGTSTTVPANILVVGEKYRWNMQAFNRDGGSSLSWTLYFTVGSDSRQQPSGNTVFTTARTTQPGRSALPANSTGLYSSQSTSGGGDGSLPFIIGGVLVAVIAGGGYFVMKRRSAPGNPPPPPPPVPPLPPRRPI